MEILNNHWGWGCPIVEPIRTFATSPIAQYFGYVNYFIPLSEMIGTMFAWLTAIAIYYGVSTLLRWAGTIS